MPSFAERLGERANGEAIAAELGLTAPVDLDKVLDYYGIRQEQGISFARMGYSGEIGSKDGNVYIWANPTESAERQRFTIAHEIGHFLIHMHGKPGATMRDDAVTLRRGGRNDLKEIQANRFAAQLLMPIALIRSEIEALISNVGSTGVTREAFITHMAKRFGVSEAAMTYRLNDLNLLPRGA